jgi:hypothetical protein
MRRYLAQELVRETGILGQDKLSQRRTKTARSHLHETLKPVQLTETESGMCSRTGG